MRLIRLTLHLLTAALLCQAPLISAADKQLLWGDTHLHTSYSFDAFLNGNQSSDPEEAYRYAKGQPVIHPYNRTRVQINTPLDFLVVSDHAEFLGGIRDIYFDGIQDKDPGLIERLVYWYREYEIRDAIDSGKGAEYFRNILPTTADPREAAKTFSEAGGAPIPGADLSARRAWKTTAEIADRYNEPGKFTALLGWEWSSIPAGANLHRVIVTNADAEQAAKFGPFRSIDSPYPEDLWDWLDKTSADTGVQMVAIPHNSNISKGLMFDDKTLRGEPFSEEYAKQRLAWEPIVEVTQIKGDSETHPSLSPDDEFADFESYPYYIQQQPGPYKAHKADFIRSGLKTGLELEAKLGVNPYQFGMIGSTDSHTGLSSAEEPNFWGKMAKDSIPENKIEPLIAGGATGWSMSASGLAAVWARDNSRDAIIDAFRSKEVYATTGSRIRVRVFGGWQFNEADMQTPDYASHGYASGVPMGGVLPAREDTAASPTFMIEAMKDAKSGNLDRIQVIKGWVDETGRSSETVYDVAWSDNRTRDEQGRLPSLPNTVDMKTGKTPDETGAAYLATVWKDPDFNPADAAFYYVRVLEIPTARHSLLDALALGMEAPSEGPATLQERAYTSPIWYRPDPGIARRPPE